MVWREYVVVAPWVQDVLAVAVESQIGLEIFFGGSEEVLMGGRFRFRESRWPAEYFRARIVGCAFAAPFITEVAVQVDSRTPNPPPRAIFSPQSVVSVSEFVAVGVDERLNEPVEVPEVFRLVVPVLDEAIDEVRH